MRQCGGTALVATRAGAGREGGDGPSTGLDAGEANARPADHISVLRI